MRARHATLVVGHASLILLFGMDYLLVFTIAQLVLASILLWQPKIRHMPERYLWLLVSFLGVHFCLKLVFLEGLENEPLFNNLATPLSLAYSPLIYFYVSTIRLGMNLGSRTHALHFIPVLLFSVVYFIVGYYTLETGDFAFVQPFKITTRIATIASHLFYIPYLLFTMIRERKDFPVINWLIVPLAVWEVLSIAILVADTLFNEISYTALIIVGICGMAFFIMSVLKNRHLFQLSVLNDTISSIRAKEEVLQRKVTELESKVDTIESEPVDGLEEETQRSGTGYERSGLTEEQASSLLHRLTTMMNSEKPYLQPELSLRDLADILEVPKHYLTEILNVRLGKNFFAFVNEFRIDEAIRKLNEDHTESLYMLALDSGFNSKATFIKYFRQKTGVTPSEYRKMKSRLPESEIVTTGLNLT